MSDKATYTQLMAVSEDELEKLGEKLGLPFLANESKDSYVRKLMAATSGECGGCKEKREITVNPSMISKPKNKDDKPRYTVTYIMPPAQKFTPAVNQRTPPCSNCPQ